ncbi:hypothetical protein C8J30_11933 [Rhodobacter viridis]|uniref:Uncharacterized protein n=1 Tax=Rhodobacter viridis TaxID=1054202 RepID=A0A318TSA1_9RHOB|nr:hypothetical protein C8J30_11933 [Rhodobacter viridis]
MRRVQGKPEFYEHRKKVKLPNPLIESGGLELLYKVSIEIFVPPHHVFDYAPGRKKSKLRRDLLEVWVQNFW